MAYAVLKKKRRLHNPGKKRRKMSAKQIRIFGTKAQKAGLKRRRVKKNPSIRKTYKHLGKRGRSAGALSEKAFRYYKDGDKAKGRATRAAKRRRANVGSILVASIPGNPGERKHKGMAKARKRRRARVAVSRRRRRRSNPVARRRSYRRRRSNPVARYTRRRRVHHRRSGRRRSNPGVGVGGGDFQAVAGILSGAAVTRVLSGFIPAQFNQGIIGYIATGIVAMLQGQFIGKALKKPAFGKLMTYGGFTYVGLRVINDLMPSLGGYLPFGLSGMGVISPSQGFFSPQVNRWGSMGSFVLPNSVAGAIAASAPKASGMHGIGEGSVSTRRVGRVQ